VSERTIWDASIRPEGIELAPYDFPGSSFHPRGLCRWDEVRELLVGGAVGVLAIGVIAWLLRRLGIPRPPVPPPPPRPPGPPLGPEPPIPGTASNGPPAISRIALPSTVDTGVFARYVPFGDNREVIVRRGSQMGYRYGIESGRRIVTLHGRELWVVRSTAILSPPVLRPGERVMSAAAAKQYSPESEVLYLPDAEVLIRREPNGFSDAEVAKILAAISFV
jgi:hypothetical protein